MSPTTRNLPGLLCLLCVIVFCLNGYSSHDAVASESTIEAENNYRSGLSLIGSQNRSKQKKGIELLDKAAHKGHILANYRLGICYRQGKIVGQDYKKALQYFYGAARKGHADSQYEVGLICLFGRGVEENYSFAKEMFEMAAAQGHPAAQAELGGLYDHAKGVSRDYAVAKEWYEKAAASGNSLGLNNLGILYYFGRGVKKDYRKAFKLVKKAAEKGDNSTAMDNTGDLYEKGHGVERNLDQALFWYKKSAAMGNAKGKEHLAKLQAKLSSQKRKEEPKITKYDRNRNKEREKLDRMDREIRENMQGKVPNRRIDSRTLSVELVPFNEYWYISITSKVDNLTIYDLEGNGGNAVIAKYGGSVPRTLKLGEERSYAYFSLKRLREVKIYTNKGIGTFYF